MRAVSPDRAAWGLAVALTALTIAIYAPVSGFEFLNYDDDVYVTENAHVSAGLSAANLRWSLTAFDGGTWHPLTLWSHMLDVQLFGVHPGAPHVENLILHVVNALLLFWLLDAATSRTVPSAAVAALFAVHPLNVQTVAWIAERKSLLSTTFWFLALIAHVRYRRESDRRYYFATIALAALALLAKPMAVTLPLTLVLLDLWPLGVRPPGKSVIGAYAKELAPFLALSLASGILTLVAQRSVQAMQTLQSYPWSFRLGNAVVSYAWYLKVVVWPSGLAAFYPHPMETLPVGVIVVAAVALAALIALVYLGRSIPGVVMGCVWYVGTMLPVAGFIQVGSQAYADRYAYIPLIGIFIAIVWTVVTFTERRAIVWRRAAGVAAAAWIAALSLVARQQALHWHDSVSLFQHAIDVVPNNAMAHMSLGLAYVRRNRMAEALDHFQQAATISPSDVHAYALVSAGNALRLLGRPAEAVREYEQALEMTPDDPSMHFNLALALLDLHRSDEAVTHLNEVIRLNTSYVNARFLLAAQLAQRGQLTEAMEQLRTVQKLDPQHPDVEKWMKWIEELQRQ